MFNRQFLVKDGRETGAILVRVGDDGGESELVLRDVRLHGPRRPVRAVVEHKKWVEKGVALGQLLEECRPRGGVE